MGLFSKKKEAKREEEELSLPKLPKLPEFADESPSEKLISQLPRFPAEKEEFSLEKPGEKEDLAAANEFVMEQMMPKPLSIKPPKFEFPRKEEKSKEEFELKGWHPETKKSTRVFIKIDKFEESLRAFEQIKHKVSEMEKLLADIKFLKEKEEKELSFWISEIQAIKSQTEKIERDIFSKIE